MAIVRMAVLLFAYPMGRRLSLKDKLWYEKYFFSLQDGLAAYWAKQTNNNLLLQGQVFDWAMVDSPHVTFDKRYITIKNAIKSLENDRDVNFNPYEIIVTVVAVPPGIDVDGGAVEVPSSDRRHTGIALAEKSPFDFIAHELGHGLNMQHSFGDPSYKNASWSQFGEYGHPYCIMSARGYGGRGASYTPKPPKDNRAEYTCLGPGLNAATAVARGWLPAANFTIRAGAVAEFEIASRHTNSVSPPRAVKVNGALESFVIEYRENYDWDMGQGESLLIITQDKGCLADKYYAGLNMGQYVGKIKVPVSLGAYDSVFNSQGFGVEVVAQDFYKHTVTVRVQCRTVLPKVVKVSSATALLQTEVAERGIVEFKKGEVFCAEGMWSYEKKLNWQEAVLETRYDAVRPPVTVEWKADNQLLTGLSGVIELDKTVLAAQVKTVPVTMQKRITLAYTIENNATGSKLKLRNVPDDECYMVDILAVVKTSAGTGIDTAKVEFTGKEYVLPPEFQEQRDRCFRKWMGERIKYKILVPSDIWDEIPGDKFEKVNEYLSVLGYLKGRNNRKGFNQLKAILAGLIGRPLPGLTVIDTGIAKKLKPYKAKRINKKVQGSISNKGRKR